MFYPIQILSRFFRVMVSGQSYLNLLYLLASFPLGVFYFVYLVLGMSLGISLSIVWVGIPILLIVGMGWWILARFERLMAVYWLKEPVSSMVASEGEPSSTWGFIKLTLANPVTWKSPIYLFLKFPLGMATFSILVTLLSISIALLTLPLTYEVFDFQIGGFFRPDQEAWKIDGVGEALLGTLIGLISLAITIHITNGLAWLHAKFARLMLSVDPLR